MPRSEAEWMEVEKTFRKWNFPHCVGAMDGKHIAIEAPMNCGTEYFNYKGYHSIVLFAVVDGNYNFVYSNIGCQGRISDSGVFNSSYFKRCLEDGTMYLPTPSELPGRTTTSPYVFLGDDAFPLTENIMKPFPGNYDYGTKERIFNYRVSRGRRISENVFGIISSVYRVLRKPMLLEPEIARKVVSAIVHLHNYLRHSSSRNIYNPSGSFDQECSATGKITKEGIWRKDVEVKLGGLSNLPKVARKSAANAQSVRNEFMEYFSSPEGEVDFQYNAA